MAHGDHLKYQAKPKAGRQTLFRLTSYLVCDRLLLSVIGVLIVLSIAANLGGSYLLRPIINRYIIPGDFLGLGKMLGILIGVYLTGVFAVYVEYRLLNKIGQRTAGLYIVLHTFLEEVANDVRKKNPRDAAKLLGSSLHWLRHTFAVASLEVMPVNVVQTAMGHASVNTTTRYISPDQTEVLEGFKKLKS